MKNMVSALHSSRPGGTKQFMLGGVAFGWETIEGMWEREMERTDPVKGRQMAKLPGMQESYIVRDSWTKLNVKPAKIMQVCGVTLRPYRSSTVGVLLCPRICCFTLIVFLWSVKHCNCFPL